MSVNKLLTAVEKSCFDFQFGSRRSRVTGMHLLELADYVSEGASGGNFAYVSTLNIDGAFGAVLRHRPVLTSETARAERRLV